MDRRLMTVALIALIVVATVGAMAQANKQEQVTSCLRPFVRQSESARHNDVQRPDVLFRVKDRFRRIPEEPGKIRQVTSR
jgi:hypothetical protein